jgi:hypothetical protein
VLHRTKREREREKEREGGREREASEGVCADSTEHPLVIYVSMFPFFAFLKQTSSKTENK